MNAPLQVEHVAPATPEVTTEQAVLGALLMNSDAWLRVSDLLKPEMFSVPEHAIVYQAGLNLFSSGQPIDLVTVVGELNRTGKIKLAGGALFISQLTNRMSSSVNLEYHARLIIQQYLSRRIEGLALEIATDTEPDPFNKLDKISAYVTDLYSTTQPSITMDASEQVAELLDTKPVQHFTFGIPDLDRLAILEAGLPVVMAGRPGIGKSIICLEICWHLTLKGPVMLFSPEMTPKQVTARILARESGVPYSTILRGKMHEEELALVADASNRCASRLELLKIDPQSGITPNQIRTRTERAMKSHGVIAFAVDHLHKMTTGDARIDRDQVQMVGKCMSGVTEVAKNTGLPALVMCQLSRQVEQRADKRPNMADLKWSGDIEQDAAVIGLLYREGYYMQTPPFEDELEISIAKNRDGALDVARARITPAFSRIGEHIRSMRELTETVNAPF